MNNTQSARQFPSGFLWGAATSSYQVEGGITNNTWAQAARDGKVPAAGEACEHASRFDTDFDFATNLGHSVHRFSLEWARIEPKRGRFDREAIERYRCALEALHARGITPMVTIWHWTQPV
jgi:beta-glucosidase